jgi:outer membrane autotransporter protein
MNGMNGNTNGCLSKTRITRTFKLAPTTRAIRAALAASFTVMALAGSGVALAGTCVTTATDTVSCNGDFTNLPDGSFVPAVDLTLILGDSTPTSVTPAAGVIGVDATWGGNVGVISHATVTTAGADGIHQYGSTSATLSNDGSITTNVTAAGANAVDISAYGDVGVVNNGPIDAYSTGVYDVTTVSAYSIHGKVTVDNQSAGTISATAQDGNAIALFASSYGDNVVSNEGTITASTVYGIAVGVVAQAYNGNASVTNSGNISATSTYYQAVGLLASSSNGYATLGNSGTVRATGGQDQAIGIDASAALGSSIDNSGNVYATSSQGESIGISAESYSGTASVTNSGSIHSKNSGTYAAIGVLASSINGQAAIDNSGFVQSINYHGAGIGLEADSVSGSSITNSGYVLGGSYASDATGLLATATSGDVLVTNTTSGYIRTVSLGSDYFKAIGIAAHAPDGTVNVSNDGSIFAEALHGKAEGIQAAGGGDVYVENSGSVKVFNAYYNNAVGISARSNNSTATVINTGSIYAYSSPRLGQFTDSTIVDGIFAVSDAGHFDAGSYGPTAVSTVVNSGYINARGAWTVSGIAAGSYGGTSVTNTESGSIYARGLTVKGIEVVETPNSYAGFGLGDVTVVNAGSIRVDQVADCYCNNHNPYGYGISVVSAFGGDIAISNTGSIAVNTEHGAFGIGAYGFLGETTESNSGSIVLSGGAAAGEFQLVGESARSAYGGVYVVNSGDITIVSTPVAGKLYVGSLAKGMYAEAGRAGSRGFYRGGDDAILVNTGQIDVNSHIGYGMWGRSQYAVAQVYNAGSITLNDDFVSVGMTASAGNSVVYGVGSVMLDNTGSVSAIASNLATGLRAYTRGAAYAGYPGIDVAVDNSGYVLVSSQNQSQGILGFSFSDDAFVVNNSGVVVANATVSDRTDFFAHASGNAVGIHTGNYGGGATITNSGAITATTLEDDQQPGMAAGIFAQNGTPTHYLQILGIGYGDTSITNSGSISASLVSSNTLQVVPLPPRTYFGEQAQFGPSNTASGILALSSYGDVAITNGGTITSSAKSDHYAAGGIDNGVTTSNGIAVVSTVGVYDYPAVFHYVYNPTTYYFDKVYDGVASSFTLGDITLTNAAGGTITAYAKSTDASGDTALANGISALVAMGNYGGSLVSADTGITIDNAGTVSATAVIANDPTGIAIANGISAINESTAGFVNVTNSGHVFAMATGPSGTATGLLASGAVVTANNSGSLSATFNGTGGHAYGANITSAGDLTFTNSGQVFAMNVDDAVGVQLNSATTTTLVNSGSISAASSTGNSIAVQTGDSTDTIQNTGILNGAIITHGGDDTLTNSVGGVWNALGSSTDFGSGDDTIDNAGTIHMSNSAISLGTDPLGNTFANSGLITVTGNNSIDMGAGNSIAFSNTGTVEFRNAAPIDMLTLLGDWSGNGQIGVDVSGLQGTGDQLHINGNVAAGSTTTVNVDVLDLPNNAAALIPVVFVSGNSTASSFALGNVHFNENTSFLAVTFGVSLTSVIDASNITPDVFSVDMSVTGLTDTGALAADIAPGAQSLMGSEIGTWRQRMGVIDHDRKHGISLWARWFQDDGTVNAAHLASNFGNGGNFAFNQKNSGEEIGADYAFTDQFSAGLMLGNAQASQSLNGTGVGSTKFKGNTTGVYATWMSPGGFYVDGSYRRMSFDAHLNSVAGQTRTHGTLDAFNLEAGYAWTLGDGFILEPQVQYTSTKLGHIGMLNGALTGFTPQGGTSSRLRAGLLASKEFTSGRAVWTPYVSVSGVRELDGKNAYSINGDFFGQTSTKGTSALVEGGLAVQIGKLSVFGGLNWQSGGPLKSFTGGQLGVRYTW